MKRKLLSEEQIIAILREHEAGVATADLCRKHGMSSALNSGLTSGELTLPPQGYPI
jgi:hypothetical protein